MKYIYIYIYVYIYIYHASTSWLAILSTDVATNPLPSSHGPSKSKEDSVVFSASLGPVDLHHSSPAADVAT